MTKFMTQEQKAAIFDRLQQTKVIRVSKDKSSGTLVTRIVQADTQNIEVEDFVVSLEAENALRASLQTPPPPVVQPAPGILTEGSPAVQPPANPGVSPGEVGHWGHPDKE
jgi:hypothetical protein